MAALLARLAQCETSAAEALEKAAAAGASDGTPRLGQATLDRLDALEALLGDRAVLEALGVRVSDVEEYLQVLTDRIAAAAAGAPLDPPDDVSIVRSVSPSPPGFDLESLLARMEQCEAASAAAYDLATNADSLTARSPVTGVESALSAESSIQTLRDEHAHALHLRLEAIKSSVDEVVDSVKEVDEVMVEFKASEERWDADGEPVKMLRDDCAARSLRRKLSSLDQEGLLLSTRLHEIKQDMVAHGISPVDVATAAGGGGGLDVAAHCASQLELMLSSSHEAWAALSRFDDVAIDAWERLRSTLVFSDALSGIAALQEALLGMASAADLEAYRAATDSRFAKELTPMEAKLKAMAKELEGLGGGEEVEALRKDLEAKVAALESLLAKR